MKQKFCILMMICVTLIQTMMPVVNAVQIINKADLTYDHKINTHLQFDKNGEWHDVQAGYICYNIDGEKYPAYCISHGIHGVDEEGPYTVTIENLLTNASDVSGELIYNTIISGYPYKTPTQLGVDTNDDAYVATKQAIYSVLLNRDVQTFYKGKDEKGIKIVNAIEKIAQAGKNGNSKNKEATITVQKIGDLTKKDDKYYQEYSVKADVAIDNYTVENVTGLPDGSYITDVEGNLRTKFDHGQHFRVVIPKEGLKQDIEGSIEIKASCNTRPIFFGKAPNGNVQNYAITYAPYAIYNTTEPVQIKTNTASIHVIKKDEETLKPIFGVTFELYNASQERVDTVTTNAEGIAEIFNLYPGDYTLKETKENENYIKNETIYPIAIGFNQQITKTITNQHKKGNLKITKVDKDDHTLTLGAIEFDLLDEAKNVIAHLVTDVNGEVKIDNLNIGKYTLQETKTKREYDLCTNEDIVINWNETTELLIENEKQKGQIKIIKEDKENSAIKLEGVTFQIMDKNNHVVEELVTDKNGEAISSKLLIGEYVIQEKSLGENKQYILDETSYVVQVENKTVAEVQIQNEHKKGNLKVTKVDKDHPDITLGGIEFDLIDKSQNVVAHLVTDANGEATIENMNTGEYALKETKTKKEYKLCENKNIIIQWNKTTEMIIQNEKKKGQVEVYKLDKDNHEVKLANVEFVLLKENNKEVEKIVTNKNGYAISQEHPIGTYFLKETKTNKEYILNEELIKIQIEEDKITTIRFENEQKKGQIQIIKLSSKDSPLFNIQKGEKLKDVTFEIYNSKGELVDTIITDENGEVVSKKLPIGRYKLIEKSTTSHFLISQTEFFITLEEQEEIKKIEIENDPIIPEVKIEKTGKVYAEKNDEIPYEFFIQNKSNTELTNFTWKEYIPFENLKVTKLVTGTYSENLNYEIYYKTNKRDYQLLKAANTYQNEYLSFEYIELEKDEKIIEIKVEYHQVSKDFKSIISPILYGKVDSKAKKDDKIINTTEIIGTIGEFEVKDKSQFETIIIEKEILKKLPKTGG